MIKCFKILLVIILFITETRAGSYFDQLSTQQGLSQSGVNALITDKRGFLWIGTQNGLNRYDGQRIKQYKTNPFDSLSLTYDDITCIAIADNELMLVGSRNGLNIYNPAKDNFEQIYFEAINGEKVSQVVTGVATIGDNFLVSTLSGLYKINRSKNSWIKTRIYNHLVLDVCVFTNGNYVAVIKKGTLLKGNISKNKTEIDSSEGTDIQLKLRSNFKQFYKFNNYYYFVLGKKLIQINQDLSTQTMSVALPEKTSSIMFENNSSLWVGTENKGVYRYLYKTNSFEIADSLQEDLKVSYGLKSNYISFLYQEQNENADVVMLGTRDAGLFFYSNYKNNFKHYESILLQNNPASAASVFSIFQEGSKYLWAATYNGLSRINLEDKTVKNFFTNGTKSSQLFQNIYQDSKGNIWFGGERGLFLYNTKTENFKQVPIKDSPNPNAEVIRITEDERGDLVVATVNYIAFLNGESFNIISDAIIGNKVQKLGTIGTIRFDKENNLWIGTGKGLYYYDRTSGKFEHFNTNPRDRFSLLSSLVLEIIRDKKDQIWVCSSKGISKVVKHERKTSFVNFSTENGLPNDFVYGGVVDDKNQLWLSTNKGLSCFNTVKGTFENFDANDGLGANEFNSGAFFKNKNGELFFGGLGTLVSFNPLKMRVNKHMSKIALVTLNQVSNFSYSSGNKIKEMVFNYNENDLLFEFAAIDFTNPSKNKIAYQISDKGNQWIDLGSKKSLNFADLSPGNYKLKVKASNNLGKWNSTQVLEVPFVILPPFYKTLWFYFLIALGVALIIYAIYSYRLKTKIDNLMAIEAARADEKDQFRRTAAQDIHDEFGNSLTRISLLADVASKTLPADNTDAKEMLNKIRESALGLYNGSKDFVWALNPDNDNFYEVAFRVKDFADELFHEQNIHFTQSGLSEEFKNIKLPAGYSRQIVLMFKEAVSNIAKHAKASEVNLNFGFNKDRVTIILSDNGVGFDMDKLSDKGNGIKNILQRAQKIGAEVKFSKGVDKGVTLIFNLKY